jgi:uncharacterized repeat protein (TIGR03809 family)
MSAPQASRRFSQIARKWSDLAQRRLEHFAELDQTGRWKHYYSESQLLMRVRQANGLLETWLGIERRSSELTTEPTTARPVWSETVPKNAAARGNEQRQWPRPW